jgi:hypothetical protein
MIKCVINIEQFSILLIGVILITITNIIQNHFKLYNSKKIFKISTQKNKFYQKMLMVPLIAGWLIIFVGLVKYNNISKIPNPKTLFTLIALILIIMSKNNSISYIIGLLMIGFSIGINNDNTLDPSDIAWGLFGIMIIIVASMCNNYTNIEDIAKLIGFFIIILAASCNEKD